MKKYGIILLISLISIPGVLAQKVKYKDLYAMLESGQYVEAEPFLKTFLSDDKNKDHANANYQMGKLFEYKAKNNDVLLETNEAIQNIDTAILYYKTALTYIDEKELRKHDEYYMDFQRRDPRTGKIGIALSDVQFETEKLIGSLNDLQKSLSKLEVYFMKTKNSYSEAQSVYGELSEEYVAENQLLLRADDATLQSLNRLQDSFNIAKQNFSLFKSTLGTIENAKYDPSLTLVEIKSFPKDGQSPTTLTDNKVFFWDFNQWGEKVKADVLNIIYPLRIDLVNYDAHLNQWLARSDTAFVEKDKLQSYGSLVQRLSAVDKTPLPLLLMDIKKEQIAFNNIQKKYANYLDSADVLYQLEALNAMQTPVYQMDSLLKIIDVLNISEAVVDYQDFINKQYGGVSNFLAYKEKIGQEVDEQVKDIELGQGLLNERLKWLITASDSVPLFLDEEKRHARYKPLYLNDKVSAGVLNENGKLNGYLAFINPSRTAEKKFTVPLDPKTFTVTNKEFVEVQVLGDENGSIYYVLYFQPIIEKSDFAATVTKIYKADGLAWSKNVNLATKPLALRVDPSNGNLFITYDLQEYKGGEVIANMMVLDKFGEVVK